MRLELLYNPRLLCERLAIESVRRRRLGKLRSTPAAHLEIGHIDSLELLELLQNERISVIYDVGANIGTWTLLARAVFPDASIEAFEPVPLHNDAFCRTVGPLDRIRLHPIALGSHNGQGILHITDSSDATSLLTPTAASQKHFCVSEIARAATQVRRLDDFQAEQNLPTPDLIKLDVQGFELQALTGATFCLSQCRAVLAEASFIEFYDGQCLFHELVTFLASVGFYVTAFGANLKAGVAINQTDVLFTRRGPELS